MADKDLQKLVKAAGRHLLRSAISKVFPPDEPLTEKDKGSRYTVVRNGRQMTLYWGDLHGHSNLSTEAVGSPDEYYDYARKQRKLDFTALTDHDFSMNDKKWKILQDKAEYHNNPGSFVNFISYEWTSPFGHKVILFPGSNVPSKIMVRSRKKEDNPYNLWRFLKPYGALTIPHHTISFRITTNWFYRDNTAQPLVEIYSKHGSCEFKGSEPVPFKMSSEKNRSVLYALKNGHRLGFIGCSDTHCSKPGSEESMELLTHRLVLKYSSGLTGVYADSLTRKGVWDALVNRRTFATTGVRLFIDFRVGDYFMGEEFKADDSQEISAWVDAPEPITLLEIVKNGDVLFRTEPNKPQESVSIVDRKPEPGENFYYLRLTLKSGERAWASPIWVHYRS